MNINELDQFNLGDSVKFHDNLNPSIWTEKGKLDPEVKDQLLKIAKDFLTELGIGSFKVEDITLSGSNASYTYTPHSDLDLHILVDYNKLPDDEVYQELFNAKKTLYNDMHDIKVHGVPVELYVQDSNQPVVSAGEFSLLKDKWIKLPKKEKVSLDHSITKAKYQKLGSLIELALKSKNLELIEKLMDIIKRYRKAGLADKGEFGPENLAFKALRSKGYIKKLYDYKNELHSQELSLEDWHPNAKPPGPEFPPTMPAGTVKVDVSDVYDWYKLGQHISDLEGLGKHDFGKGPPSTILSFGDEDTEHKYIDNLMKTGLTTTDIDPKGHEPKKGQKVDPTYNVNEILDKESAAKVYWSEDNYMTGSPYNQMYTLYTAAAQDKNKNILKYNFYDFTKYDLTAIEFSRAVGPWGDNFSIDNAGDQYTVFATLIQTIKQYLSKDKPKYIMFGAKEPSRAKLYQSFINRFAGQFGYKQISSDNIPKPVSSMILNSGDTPFLLQKVGQKEQSMAEGGAETSWSDGDEKITLQDILELTKHIKQINLPINDNLKSKLIHWDGNPEEIERINQVTVSNQFPILVMLDGQGQIDWILDGNHRLHKAIRSQAKTIPAKLIKPSDLSDKAKRIFHIKEASGYIPSEKEKNDPRFKTALTVDVKPDSIKKNAKAFGWKVDRTGKPPLLRK